MEFTFARPTKLREVLELRRGPRYPIPGPSSREGAGSMAVSDYDFKDIGEEGRLKWSKKKLLGSGSNGTKVYLGTFRHFGTNNVERVAIKRIQYDSNAEYKNITHEITALQNLIHHNVIRYLFADKNEEFNLMFIALEMCRGSLINVFENHRDVFEQQFVLQNNVKCESDWWFKKHLLLGVAKGLDYIHGQNRIHRDLKPQNILVTTDNSVYGLKAVICDFEFCRKIKAGQYKLSVSQGIVGTQGWMPREVLEEAGYVSKSVDVFAFGCIVQFVMSENRDKQFTHPFGADLSRDNAIVNENRRSYISQNLNVKMEEDDMMYSDYSDYSGSSDTIEEYKYLGDAILADMLVDVCVSGDFNSIRPLASEILEHPFFWSYERRTQSVERMFNDFKYTFQRNDLIISHMETIWSNVRRREYSTMIPEVWEYYMLFREKTKGKKPSPQITATIFNCLMRLIRNLQQHWTDAIVIHPELEDVLGNGDNELLGRYFFEKIPMSFPVIYTCYQWQYGVGDTKKSLAAKQKIFQLAQETLYTLHDSVEERY